MQRLQSAAILAAFFCAAHSVRFYKDNALLQEVVGNGASWALDLDTTHLPDGQGSFGFNAATLEYGDLLADGVIAP